MADNVLAKDGGGNEFQLRSRDISLAGDGSLQVAMSLPSDAFGNPMGIPANPLISAEGMVGANGTFNRPSNTTAYTSGQLVANDTNVNNVVPMQFALARAASAYVRVYRAFLNKSGTGTTGAIFRAHLFSNPPMGLVNGDGGTLTLSNGSYRGWIDFDMTGAHSRVFADGVRAFGVPDVGPFMLGSATSQLWYGLLEARGSYTPLSAETFTLGLEAIQG